MIRNEIIIGDVLDPATWADIPDQSVHCVVTSPPYWGLRDYGTAVWEGGNAECDHKPPDEGGWTSMPTSGQREHAGRFAGPACHKCGAKRIDAQLGLEATPELYVERMVAVFRHVWRVLRDDGTLWLNLGDSYAQRGGKMVDEAELAQRASVAHTLTGGGCKTWLERGDRAANTAVSGLKPKDLCGIPWRVALALQADGWYLRQDIVWAKPNPMPESCRDRCTKAHEYIFLMTKRPRYFYDAEAVKEPVTASTVERLSQDGLESQAGSDRVPFKTNGPMKAVGSTTTRNKRSVWTVPTAPYSEAHFATFPPKLIEPCILAGTSAKGCCPECGAPWRRVTETERIRTRPGHNSKAYDRATGLDVDDDMEKPWRDRAEIGNRDPGRHVSETRTIGWEPGCECQKDANELRHDAGVECCTTPMSTSPCIVLDPFMGSGTTGMVARQHGRDYIGIELSEEYAKMARDRIAKETEPGYVAQDIPDDSTLFPDTGGAKTAT